MHFEFFFSIFILPTLKERIMMKNLAFQKNRCSVVVVSQRVLWEFDELTVLYLHLFFVFFC